MLEEQQYVFWSLQLLDQLIGQEFVAPNTARDIFTPTYWGTSLVETSHPAKVPALPYDESQDPGKNGPGMWAILVQLTMIWGLTRKYVSECAEGRNESPWSPTSTYTQINSVLLEAESRLPDAYRFDVLRLDKILVEKIREKRHVWLMWIYIQIIYHSVHAVLNHPFIYFQKASQNKPGRNVFWRTASELACLHSMWVTRIIEMAAKSQLCISDPFIAQFAAISATLHLYQSRVSDQQQRTRALAGLETCTEAVGELGRYWPVCKHMVRLAFQNFPHRGMLAKKDPWLVSDSPESHRECHVDQRVGGAYICKNVLEH